MASHRKFRPLPEWLDKYMPPRGRCEICGGPDARHRLTDAIVGRIEAGELAHEVARDYRLPERVVRLLVAWYREPLPRR